MATLPRRAYAEMFGPTVGDRVRLADTDLIIEVEQDFTLRAGEGRLGADGQAVGYGEEVKFGGGKTIRDGMGQSQRVNGPGAGEAVDCVITNALILDHWGIVKADIGLRGHRICAIGKAGNPDVQPGVDIVIGPPHKPTSAMIPIMPVKIRLAARLAWAGCCGGSVSSNPLGALVALKLVEVLFKLVVLQ